METKAIVRGVRLSTDKGRLVADLIRGKKVGHALNVLEFTQKKAAGIIKRVMPVDAGYEQEYDLDVDKTTHSMGVSKGVRRVAESDLTTSENMNADPVDEAQWKAPSDYAEDGGCKKCKWGAPGTGHSSGYHKNDCAVLKKEQDLYKHFQGAERRNFLNEDMTSSVAFADALGRGEAVHEGAALSGIQ